jgi:hypothetical protein
MAVYKIFPSADATIYSSYPTKNAGRDEVLEVSAKNSQDSLRFVSRAVANQSPYYNYDLAVNDNYSIPASVPATFEFSNLRATRAVSNTVRMPKIATTIRQPNGVIPKMFSPNAMSHFPTGGWTTKAGSVT